MTQTTARPVPQAPDEQGNYAGYRVPITRRPWFQKAMPWVTSLAIHAGVVVLALVLLATPAFQTLIQQVTQQQVNVPTTELAETSIGGVPNVGNMDDVTSPNAQLEPVQQSDNPLPAGEGELAAALNTTSASSPASSSLSGITGAGSLAEALGGGGGGSGSTLFGEPGGGGKFMGFDVGIKGDGGRVYKIAFVSDASGSMEGRGKIFLVSELKKGVDPLNPTQFFNVIFFRNDESYEAIFPRLVPALPKNLRECYESVQRTTFAGSTNPLPALEAAFEMKPELIFFLTDGAFNGKVSYDDVTEAVRRLNRDGSVMINTVQLITTEGQQEDKEAAAVLEKIAQENRGKYKAVSAFD